LDEHRLTNDSSKLACSSHTEQPGSVQTCARTLFLFIGLDAGSHLRLARGARRHCCGRHSHPPNPGRAKTRPFSRVEMARRTVRRSVQMIFQARLYVLPQGWARWLPTARMFSPPRPWPRRDAAFSPSEYRRTMLPPSSLVSLSGRAGLISYCALGRALMLKCSFQASLFLPIRSNLAQSKRARVKEHF